MFLSPVKNVLHSPYLLANINALTNTIIEECVRKQKKTYIFADVDPDGISSTAIMHNYLKPLNKNVKYFHSQRSDGHGISLALDLVPNDCEVLIIVDSSSNDVEACKALQERGVQVVIIDHHEVERENPYCILVNPKQPDCNYPNTQASGSMLCWKVCQVLDDKLQQARSKELIDLAGLGLYSDMQDMSVLENRYVVNQMFGNIRNLGYKALLKALDKDKVKLSTTVIGFDITPCINAATRLDSIEVPLELFTTTDPNRAEELANRLKENNIERKKRQKEIVNKLKEQIDTYVSDDNKCLFINDSTIGKGYNGLIANDLARHYKRPVFVLGETGDSVGGSYRSYAGINMLELLRGVAVLDNVGGHEFAGGMSVNKLNYDEAIYGINSLLRKYKVDDAIYYDLEVDAEHINEKNIKQYEDIFNISGTGFTKSNLLIKNLIIKDIKVLGDGDTFKIGCVSEFEHLMGENHPNIYCMKFKANEDFGNQFEIGDKIEVIGTLNLNTWARYKPRYEVVKTKQIMIEDLRVVKAD